MAILNIIKNYIISWKYRNMPKVYDEYDPNAFGADVVAGEVTRDDLTDKDFQTITLLEWVDQRWTDFCVGAGRSYGGQGTEKRVMSWRGAFALGCKYLGYIPGWGISIMAVCMGAVKWGTPEKELCKFDWTKTRNWNADWRNISGEAMLNAAKHKQNSATVIKIQPGWDKFDTFRAYLNKFKDKKIVIQTGVDGHNCTLFGQKVISGEIKIYGPDSYGRKDKNYRIGKCVDGIRYFARSEVNQLFNGYIVFDIERELVELLNQVNNKGIKLEGNPDVYIVYNGQKHLLKNEFAMWCWDIRDFPEPQDVFVLPEYEFNKIPEGAEAIYYEGPRYKKEYQSSQRIIQIVINKGIKSVEDLINMD